MAHIGFKKLADKLKSKVSNPDAVAACIGQKKYGKKKMAEAAKKGKSLKESKAK